MSYAVSAATREIGIRMALGAHSGAVAGLIVRQGMALTAIAMLLGWPAAWLLSKLASSFLYGVQAHDLVTFITVPILLTMIALIACWLPARRAASCRSGSSVENGVGEDDADRPHDGAALGVSSRMPRRSG